MEGTGMGMIMWMCGVSLIERQPSTELRRHLGVEAIGDEKMQTEVAWTCGKKGRCRLCEDIY